MHRCGQAPSQGSQCSRPKSSDWSRSEPGITIVPSCPGRKCTSAQRSVGQPASVPYAGAAPTVKCGYRVPGATGTHSGFSRSAILPGGVILDLIGLRFLNESAPLIRAAAPITVSACKLCFRLTISRLEPIARC
jgi:hypothetical protein